MPTSSIEMDLNDLSELSERLNITTDQLNAQLLGIEERINALSLGVEAWATRSPLQEVFGTERAVLAENAVLPLTALGNPTRRRTAMELGYARFPEGWKLAVRTVHYEQTRVNEFPAEWLDPMEGAERGIEISQDAKPLLRASRTTRTLAVDRIGDLIRALYVAGSQVADAVEKARKISDSLTQRPTT